MKLTKYMKAACVVGVVSACALAFGLTGCGGSDTTEEENAVAATVNGVEILEDTITEYVENFRTAYSLDDEDSWGEWLASNDMTPEEVREEVIDYYVEEELIRQGAEANDVTVDSDTVDTMVEAMKANYDDDDAWQEALENAGTTEEAYWELVELSMLESALEEAMGVGEAPTDEEIIDYAAYYDESRRSSHILFDADDEETAQEVLDMLNNGEIEFVDAVAQYSTDTTSAEEDGDVGWDSLTTFVDEYADALAELSEGEMSGLVESDYGWHIILCTEHFTVSEDGIESTDDIPEAILEEITETLQSENDSDAYDEWFEEFKESAEIVVNDMPEGLPYDVDMDLYTTDDEEATEDEDATEDESTDDEATDDEATDESADDADDADDESDDAEDDESDE